MNPMFADMDPHIIHALLQRAVTIATSCLLVIVLGGILNSLLWGWIKKKSFMAFDAWRSAPFLGKILLPSLVIADIFAGGGKAPSAHSLDVDEGHQPNVQMVDVVQGYNAPIEGVPDEDVFTRPDEAFTPLRWRGLGVSHDWQSLPGGLSACAGGVVTTQGFGSSDWGFALPGVSVYAPFVGEHSILPGVSDFWCVTNALYKRFVWKDVANGRNPDQLISFAAQVSECGDVIYVYNDSALASTNITSFLQINGERMPVAPTQTNLCAVLIERDLQQTPEWWVSQYPELCELNAEGEVVWTYDEGEYYCIEVCLSGDDELMAARSSGAVTINLAQAEARLQVHRLESESEMKVVIHRKVSGTSQKVKLLLETGVRYEVFARYTDKYGDHDCPIVIVSTPNGVNAVQIEDCKWLVWRPVNLLISPVNQPSGKYNRFHASLSPAISKGSYTWSASGPFRVATPTGQTTEVFRDGSGAGTLTCVWRRGALATTNTIALAATDMSQGGDYFGISLDRPVILKEDAHLDVNGNAVPASSPTSRLALTYSGNTAGEIEISSNDTNVRLRDGFVLRELPIQISVSEPVDRTWEIDLSQVSEDVHEIEFTSRFTPSESNVSFDNQATLRIAKLTVEAEATWPDERRRHVFGPCEAATARIEPASLAPTWRDGSRQASGSSFALPAPNAAVEKNISVEIAGTSIDIPLRYIAPASCVATAAYAMTDDDWRQHTNFAPPGVNGMGAGLKTDLKLMPDVVSFAGLHIQEGYSPASGAWGYYEPYGSQLGGHGEREGAGRDVTVTEGNVVGTDYAGHAQNSIPPGLSLGGYEFRIPMYWSVNATQGTCFVTNVQKYVVYPNADFKVTKFGYSVLRHANGVYETPQEEHE